MIKIYVSSLPSGKHHVKIKFTNTMQTFTLLSNDTEDEAKFTSEMLRYAIAKENSIFGDGEMPPPLRGNR